MKCQYLTNTIIYSICLCPGSSGTSPGLMDFEVFVEQYLIENMTIYSLCATGQIILNFRSTGALHIDKVGYYWGALKLDARFYLIVCPCMVL